MLKMYTEYAIEFLNDGKWSRISTQYRSLKEAREAQSEFLENHDRVRIIKISISENEIDD